MSFKVIEDKTTEYYTNEKSTKGRDIQKGTVSIITMENQLQQREQQKMERIETEIEMNQ